MSLALLNPWAMALAALAAPLVLLYLRQVQGRRVAVSTGFLWAQVFSTAERSAAWKKRRRLASLALALGILAAIVLGAAGPDSRRPQRTVLVVDNAGGMGGDSSALAAVKRQARAFVAAMGPRDRTAVVATVGALRVRCGMTALQPALDAALDALAAGAGDDGRIDRAVELAERLLADELHARVVVVSDSPQRRARAQRAEVEWLGPDDPAPVSARLTPWSFLGIVAAALALAEWGLYQRRWVE